MREICKRMGITRTAFYYHYDELFAVLNDVMEDLATGIGLDDIFSAWSDSEWTDVDVPCKVAMDRIGCYIVINDCRCLLSNTMLSGSLVNYLIEKESLIAIPRIVSFAGIPEQEAKQAFRFTFAGIFSIYSSYDWSKHTIKDFPKELIRKCCATTIKSTLQSESTVSDRLQRGLSND